MDAEEFRKHLIDTAEKDYGMCPPPLNADKALDILISHFLGEDWYVVMPISREQIYSEAVYAMLRKYPKKKGILRLFQIRR